jgi:hypothetical protein
VSIEMPEVAMNAHAVSYPSLQRRLIAERRSRALFLRPTTQHLSGTSLRREIARVAIALAGIALWGAAVLVLAQ